MLIFRAWATCDQMRLLVWRDVVLSHVSNIVMLTINSRSPWEMIWGFNLTVTRREKRLSRGR